MNESNYFDANVFLASCDEEIIRYIELQLQFAKDVRAYQLEYSVLNEEFAEEFGCSLNEVELLRKGGIEVSVRDMAKLRTLYAKRIAEEKARLKFEGK